MRLEQREGYIMKRTGGILYKNSKRVMAAMLSAAMVLSGIYMDGTKREVHAAELQGAIDFYKGII